MDTEIKEAMTDQPDERKAVVEQALDYIGSHRPEPTKCEYCGCSQSFSPMAGSFAQFCPKAPAGEGHVYMFSVSNEYPETIEAERLADFALLREGELRKRVQELEQADIKRVQDISRFVIERDEARAENERLRVALKNISQIGDHLSLRKVREISRAALNPAPPSTQTVKEGECE